MHFCRDQFRYVDLQFRLLLFKLLNSLRHLILAVDSLLELTLELSNTALVGSVDESQLVYLSSLAFSNAFHLGLKGANGSHAPVELVEKRASAFEEFVTRYLFQGGVSESRRIHAGDGNGDRAHQVPIFCDFFKYIVVYIDNSR